MHPLMQQRRDVLESLRQRSTFMALATPNAGTATKGLLAPLGLSGAAVFQVLPQGGNVFQVVERSTGRLMGTRVGHVSACSYAAELENDTCSPTELITTPSRERSSVEQRVRIAVVTLALGVLLAGATLYS